MTGIVAARYIVEHPVVQPGNHYLALLLSDGKLLCPKCADQKWHCILKSWVRKSLDDWFPACAIIVPTAYHPAVHLDACICLNCKQVIGK